MFKVIEGGAKENHGLLRLPQQSSNMTTSVNLPTKRPAVAEMLRQCTKGMECEDDLHAAIQTYPTLGEFAEKAAEFITSYFPATSSLYPCLLTEVLDRAAIGLMRPSSRNPREQVAHFLANGVRAATNGLLAHRVQQVQNGVLQDWLAWDDGPLADWAQWNGSSLEFTVSLNQAPEVQHVFGYVVQRSLLSYSAALSIARAGIDLQTLSTY